MATILMLGFTENAEDEENAMLTVVGSGEKCLKVHSKTQDVFCEDDEYDEEDYFLNHSNVICRNDSMIIVSGNCLTMFPDCAKKAIDENSAPADVREEIKDSGSNGPLYKAFVKGFLK